MKLMLLLGGLAMTPSLHAQDVYPQCRGLPLLEYQVERQARFLPDSGIDIFPIDTAGNPRNLVQFVVDSSGRVVVGSFQARLIAAESELEAARMLSHRWRFAPATNGGRPVCQLVATYLRRTSSAR